MTYNSTTEFEAIFPYLDRRMRLHSWLSLNPREGYTVYRDDGYCLWCDISGENLGEIFRTHPKLLVYNYLDVTATIQQIGFMQMQFGV